MATVFVFGESKRSGHCRVGLRSDQQPELGLLSGIQLSHEEETPLDFLPALVLELNVGLPVFVRHHLGLG